MNSLNKKPKTSIIGRLGQDILLKEYNHPLTIVEFALAVNISVKDKTTETWANNTLWYDITAFNNVAVRLAKLKKGTLIIADCVLDIQKWVDKETQKPRKSLSLILDDFGVLDRPHDASLINTLDNNEFSRNSNSSTYSAGNSEHVSDDDLDVIPFI